ncbi:MAG: aminotransferase class I/II-fold pyridoxal phosphate-dependent enzyme [Candidatus Micrarchaeota archaeon]|nr:aminotransferase class I/II-fold pyridoxal phosphate-dependent enzyme [Candidatus Micrarchaeota archaeon]
MDSKLAIFGGPKAIQIEQPHYMWPVISKETENAVLEQLHKTISIYDKSGIIDDVEKQLANYYKRKYALLINSGTMALYTMFVSAGLKKGDEVIVPVYNFPASVTPLFFIGAIPILCDAESVTGNIDPKAIEKKITKKTKAISVTHMWGIPCDMDEICEIAERHGLMLFEDFSHSHGAEFKGKLTGSFGNSAAASLQGQKILTGGEGGVFLTDDKEMYDKAILLGHYNKRALQEIEKDSPLYKFGVTGMGFKLRVHPLAAAIIHEQFPHLNEWLRQKRIFANLMNNFLKDMAGVETLDVPSYKKPSWYAYLFRYKSKELGGLEIEKFYKALKAEGCSEADIPKSTCPLNALPLFKNPNELFDGYKAPSPEQFPMAEDFYNNTIKLPVWTDSKDKVFVDLYLKTIEKVVINYRELL